LSDRSSDSSLLLHSRVVSRDRFARLSSHVSSRYTYNTVRDTRNSRSLKTNPRRGALYSFLNTAFVLDRRVRSFASMPPCHARYLLIVVARWKPVSPRHRRRAERHASRRSSAARSASAARAFLSLERPRGSPVGYLSRCFGVGRVAYCPGEPRLKPP